MCVIRVAVGKWNVAAIVVGAWEIMRAVADGQAENCSNGRIAGRKTGRKTSGKNNSPESAPSSSAERCPVILHWRTLSPGRGDLTTASLSVINFIDECGDKLHAKSIRRCKITNNNQSVTQY